MYRRVWGVIAMDFRTRDQILLPAVEAGVLNIGPPRKLPKKSIEIAAIDTVIALKPIVIKRGLPGGSVVNNPTANAEDTCLIPGLVRFLEKEWQCSPVFFLGNPVDTEDLWLQSMGSQKQLDMT